MENFLDLRIILILVGIICKGFKKNW